MASLAGKVFFHDRLAGILEKTGPYQTTFQYNPGYLASQSPKIAHSLPLQKEPYVCTEGLHPFFDNLVAEGWLERAQTRLIGRQNVSRFELLLSFGRDCAGAVSVVDDHPSTLIEDLSARLEKKEIASLRSRASLSGVQAKLAIVQDRAQYRVATEEELSTDIAKFSAPEHADLIFNEYLTTLALKELLPQLAVADLHIGEVQGIDEPVLLIKRFDRGPNRQRIHFEEINQIFQKYSSQKYFGNYEDISQFILSEPHMLTTDNYKIFCQIIASILLSNTDLHLKNFAFFHTNLGLRLTPAYDNVSAALYGYNRMALGMSGAENLRIETLRPKNIIALCRSFSLSLDLLEHIQAQMNLNKAASQEAIRNAPYGSPSLKENLIKTMEQRWTTIFASIGKVLLHKPKLDENKNV